MKRQTILLIEDNPDDELLTIRAFERNRISNAIVVAHDGAEALDYLYAEGMYKDRDPSEVPELILLDLKLPKINGLEVLKRIRSEHLTKYVPVVILTSSSEEKDILSSYDLGANSYVQKPVDFDEFMEATRQLGLYWLLLNKTASPT